MPPAGVSVNSPWAPVQNDELGVLRKANSSRRGLPPERLVAVRIAPETVDDRLVLHLVFQGLGIVQRFEEGHGDLVDAGRFAVLVRHVEELPALQQDRPVGTHAHRLLRQG